MLRYTFGLRGLGLGCKLGQAAALEHQSGDHGSRDEDQCGPEKRRRVAMKQGRLEVGRRRCPADEVGRGCTGGQGIEQRGADGSSHLLGGVEGRRSHAGVLGGQTQCSGAEGGGQAQTEPDTQHEQIGKYVAHVGGMQPDQVESEQGAGTHEHPDRHDRRTGAGREEGDPLLELADGVPEELVAPVTVIEHVKGRLAGYKAPRRVRFVQSIGRSPSGKVDYNRHRAETVEWLAALSPR